MPRVLRVAAVSIVVALFAACGSDDEDPSAAATTVAPTTTAVPATTVTTIPVTLSCQPVAFTPNSEDGAGEIKATGLSCADAEAFVRQAGQRTSSGGPASVDVNGFHCVRTRSVDDPLPQAFYECTKGAMKVTFVRS